MSRGFAYLEVEDCAAAQADFESANALFPPTLRAMMGLMNTDTTSGRSSIDVLLDSREIEEADAVLSFDAPYAGEMIFNRVVLSITVEAGKYTLTLETAAP
jgi:hypothetical protein